MADGYLFSTDSDEDKAVNDILSQAMDQSILEQIAAINCSSFSNSDSNLPSHLETRFRKLKSLPITTTTTSAGVGGGSSPFPPLKSKSFGPSDDLNGDELHREFCSPEQISDSKKRSLSSSTTTGEHSDGNRDEKKGTKSKSNTKTHPNSDQKRFKSKSVSSPSADSSEEDSDGNLDEQKDTKSKSNKKTNTNSESFKQKRLNSRSGRGSCSSTTSESDSDVVSPSRRSIGCLWCSPMKKKTKKSVCRKQRKENRTGNGNDFEFLKTFSIKEQNIMKKAMKDEEKINREAEKIVKWAKQESARMMDVFGLDDDDDLSLNDYQHKKW